MPAPPGALIPSTVRDLPLAVAQAAGYMDETGMPAAEYALLPIGVNAIDATGTGGSVDNQAGVLEHLQVLRHRRPAHRQPGRQLPHRLRPIGQAGHDRAARAVGQRVPAIIVSVSIH